MKKQNAAYLEQLLSELEKSGMHVGQCFWSNGCKKPTHQNDNIYFQILGFTVNGYLVVEKVTDTGSYAGGRVALYDWEVVKKCRAELNDEGMYDAFDGKERALSAAGIVAKEKLEGRRWGYSYYPDVWSQIASASAVATIK